MNEPNCAQDDIRNTANISIARADISCGDAEEAVDATEGDEKEIRLVNIEAQADKNDLGELHLYQRTSHVRAQAGEAYRGDGAATDGDANEKEAEQPNARIQQRLSKLIPLEVVVLDNHLIAPQSFHRMDLLIFGQENRISRGVREQPEYQSRPHDGDDGQSNE